MVVTEVKLRGVVPGAGDVGIWEARQFHAIVFATPAVDFIYSNIHMQYDVFRIIVIIAVIAQTRLSCAS